MFEISTRLKRLFQGSVFETSRHRLKRLREEALINLCVACSADAVDSLASNSSIVKYASGSKDILRKPMSQETVFGVMNPILLRQKANEILAEEDESKLIEIIKTAKDKIEAKILGRIERYKVLYSETLDTIVNDYGINSEREKWEKNYADSFDSYSQDYQSGGLEAVIKSYEIDFSFSLYPLGPHPRSPFSGGDIPPTAG